MTTIAATVALVLGGPAQAQQTLPDSTAFFKALELETQGKYRDAVPLYRQSLKGENAVSAFLGLERVMNELGWLDSLLAPIDTMISRDPKEPVYRIAQLRTFQTMGREADVRRSFERWASEQPSTPAPYREYARLLLQRNQRSTADSIVGEARRRLGSINGLEVEVAQIRASTGDWIESATAWRTALVESQHMDAAAAYSLNPTPTDKRGEIRRIFLAPPVDVGARRALAELERMWGSPADGWAALRDLPADTVSARAWSEFAERAEAEERWAIAREALLAALRVERTPELSVRAATASLNAGEPGAVLTLIPIARAGTDSARIAKIYVPLHAKALSMLGRPEDAERLVAAFERWLAPGPRNSLTRTIALGWVRRGDMTQARAALAAAGPEADSSDTAGWLALYEGDLRTARALLRAGTETTPELALALATVARMKSERAPEVGQAFLAMARGDSAGAALRFVDAAERTPDAASLLLSIAAQLRSARGDDAQAIAIWKRIVETMGETPEAPAADLDWARTLKKKGDVAGAITRLEHMILSYSQSALVPQARRELEALKKHVVPGSQAMTIDRGGGAR